jgi:hypothetical protein
MPFWYAEFCDRVTQFRVNAETCWSLRTTRSFEIPAWYWEVQVVRDLAEAVDHV